MTTFLTICIACSAVFLISLLLGHDVEIGDLADFSGGHEHGDGWLSLRSLMMFGVGFGAAGTLSSYAGHPALVASGFGLIAGLVSAAVGVTAARFLVSQEGDSTPRLERLAGRRGRVTLAIPEWGTGQICVVNEFGATAYLSAIAKGQIAEGAIVTVVGVASGGTLMVEEKREGQ